MNRKPHTEETSWETDAVWALLDEAPPVKAGPHFADDLVRAVRTAPEPRGWWQRLFTPAPLIGFAVAGTAVIVAFLSLNPAAENLSAPVAVTPPEERFAALQEVVETEMLFAAVDHMDEFSDQELASLIGF